LKEEEMRLTETKIERRYLEIEIVDGFVWSKEEVTTEEPYIPPRYYTTSTKIKPVRIWGDRVLRMILDKLEG
jgi:hypothetical protein